jgi:hypothetical protein
MSRPYTVVIVTDSAIICFYLRVSGYEDPYPVAGISNTYSANIKLNQQQNLHLKSNRKKYEPL